MQTHTWASYFERSLYCLIKSVLDACTSWGFGSPEFALLLLSVSPLSLVTPPLMCQKETSMFCQLANCYEAE